MTRRVNKNINPADYADRAGHMEAVWRAGGPSPGYDYDFSGSSEYEQMLAGVFGRNPRERVKENYNQINTEQKQRPYCFVRKIQGRAVKPFFLDPTSPGPTLISLGNFESQYAAAQFAAFSDLWCDTSVTIKWKLLGFNDSINIKKSFRRFKDDLNEWLSEFKIPPAYFYAHENGQDDGLHTHMQIYVPGDGEAVWWQGAKSEANGLRKEFRDWIRKSWVKKKCGRFVPKAVHVNGHDKLYRARHWIGFHYQLKGYDTKAIVRTGDNSIDKCQLMLGDLIAFEWRNPGIVADMPRVGYSRSLGPKCREAGIPNNLGKLPVIEDQTFELSGTIMKLPQRTWWPERGPFQSRFEAGWRDIWWLYDPEFCQFVTRLTQEEAMSYDRRSKEDLASDQARLADYFANMTLT